MQILLAHKAIFQSENYLGPTGTEILMFKHDAAERAQKQYPTPCFAVGRGIKMINIKKSTLQAVKNG